MDITSILYIASLGEPIRVILRDADTARRWRFRAYNATRGVPLRMTLRGREVIIELRESERGK